MADHEQEKAREHLTEREQEIIQQLAREIIREAGIQREDREEGARRERLKSYAESLRHANTVSGATAVGAAILYTNLNIEFEGFLLALIWIGASFVTTTLGTYLCAGKKSPIANHYFVVLEICQYLSLFFLLLAVVSFVSGAMNAEPNPGHEPNP